MNKSRRHVALLTLLAVSVTLCASAEAADKSSSDDFSAGIDVRPTARVSDIGLPLYPGALRRHDKHDENPALSFGLWGGQLGVRIYVIKYRSKDGIDAVGDFYRQAMAQYGTILDCSEHPSPGSISSNSQGLDCDDEHPESGEHIYKVGSKSDQRIVALKPVAGEVHFELVRVSIKGG